MSDHQADEVLRRSDKEEANKEPLRGAEGNKEPLRGREKSVSYYYDVKSTDENGVCKLQLPETVVDTTVSKRAVVKLCVVVIFTLILCIALIVTAHLTHSLTVRVEAYHSLYNLFTLSGSLLSIKLCREPESLLNTFGWARIDVVSYVCSLMFLISLSFSVTVEAIQTVAHVGHQDAMHFSLAAILVCVTALAVNFMVYCLIGGYTQHQGSFLEVRGTGDVYVKKQVRHDSLQKGQRTLSSRNLKSVGGFSQPTTMREGFRDILRDIAGILLCIVTATIVWYDEEGQLSRYIDPAIAVISVIIVMTLSYPFAVECMNILLQTIPNYIDVEEISTRLQQSFPDILNIHHFHVWSLKPGKVVSTVHIVFASPQMYLKNTESLNKFFTEENISLVTLQPEFAKPSNLLKKSKCHCSDHIYDGGGDSCDDRFMHCSHTHEDEQTPQMICDSNQNSEAGPQIELNKAESASKASIPSIDQDDTLGSVSSIPNITSFDEEPRIENRVPETVELTVQKESIKDQPTSDDLEEKRQHDTVPGQKDETVEEAKSPVEKSVQSKVSHEECDQNVEKCSSKFPESSEDGNFSHSSQVQTIENCDSDITSQSQVKDDV